MALSVAALMAGLKACVSASSAVTRSACRVARSAAETVARSAGTGNLAVASARALPAVPLLFDVRKTINSSWWLREENVPDGEFSECARSSSFSKSRQRQRRRQSQREKGDGHETHFDLFD